MKLEYNGLNVAPVLPGLGYTIVFIAFIMIFRPSLAVAAGVMLIANVVIYIWNPKMSLREFWLQQLYTLIFLLFVYYLYYFFGGYGIIALIGITFITAGIIVWRRWKLIKPMLQWWEKSYLGMTSEERQARRKP